MFIDRCTHFLPSEMESDHANWPVARDHALVLYVDTLCRAWSTTPSRLMPDELLLSEVDLTGEDFHQLQGEVYCRFLDLYAILFSRKKQDYPFQKLVNSPKNAARLIVFSRSTLGTSTTI